MAWMIASQWQIDQVDPRFQAQALAKSRRLADALAELERMALLSWVPASQTYRLAPLARTFAYHRMALKHAKVERRPLLPIDDAMFHFA